MESLSPSELQEQADLYLSEWKQEVRRLQSKYKMSFEQVGRASDVCGRTVKDVVSTSKQPNILTVVKISLGLGIPFDITKPIKPKFEPVMTAKWRG